MGKHKKDSTENFLRKMEVCREKWSSEEESKKSSHSLDDSLFLDPLEEDISSPQLTRIDILDTSLSSNPLDLLLVIERTQQRPIWDILPRTKKELDKHLSSKPLDLPFTIEKEQKIPVPSVFPGAKKRKVHHTNRGLGRDHDFANVFF